MKLRLGYNPPPEGLGPPNYIPPAAPPKHDTPPMDTMEVLGHACGHDLHRVAGVCMKCGGSGRANPLAKFGTCPECHGQKIVSEELPPHPRNRRIDR